MIPGVEVTIGEKKYTMPPLSLGQLRNGVMLKLKEHDEAIEQSKGYEASVLKGEIVLEALKRNYPELTLDSVEFDFGNINELWLVALGLSGFKPGETPATRETPSGDGT
jgi:hypothetical protein